MDSNIIPHM